jgi:hypothetical protein
MPNAPRLSEEGSFGWAKPQTLPLTFAIKQIDTWNRLNVAFRTEAGGYRPGMFSRAKAA